MSTLVVPCPNMLQIKVKKRDDRDNITKIVSFFLGRLPLSGLSIMLKRNIFK